MPALANAQPVTGLYIGAGAGVNWINNPERWDISGNTVAGNFGLPPGVQINNAGKANFETGWAGVVSIGWGFGNGVRAEVEGITAATRSTASAASAWRRSVAPAGSSKATASW
ncbi:hypothetical protein ACFQU2_31030 [Siccirubricoccus deserti]